MKDPAFLFYSKDFYEGTRMMLPEERACYVDLLIYQHQNGIIPLDLKRVLMYCNGVDEATLKATLEAKFTKTEEGWVCRDKYLIALKHKKGSNHWNWKGGLSDVETKFRISAPYVRWKKKVLRRDDYRRTQCGSESKLHVHHIKPYAEYKSLRIVISNGITLCQRCHILTHKKLRNE